jgi:ribosome-associated translation inhibitor RaiA
MTLDQELDQELIAFMCRRFEQCDCLVDIETSVEALQSDINCNASYTLVDGALDKMRAAYKKRLDELKERLTPVLQRDNVSESIEHR